MPSKGVWCLALCASAVALKSDDLRRAPVLPLGLFQHLERAEKSAVFDFEAAQAPLPQLTFSDKNKHEYETHWFDQLTSHDPQVPAPANRTTFKQRYWLDAQYYKPGGPVFLLDAGETSGANRLPFLKQGILQILAKATGGAAIVFEHRYYGKSFPVDELTTDSFRFLTTMQSLQDLAHFARTAKLPGLEKCNLTSNDAPWIVYGGSYAGAKAALARKLFPDVFWGGIASSAVTVAIVDYWRYFDAIREHAPKKCMSALQNHTELIDTLLNFKNPFVTGTLKSFFGLTNVTLDADFVNALALPLGTWQARNWDPKVGSDAFDGFCDALARDTDGEADSVVPASLEPLVRKALPFWPQDPRKALARFASYAAYIKANVSSLCPPDMQQDDCFGVGEYKGHSLDASSYLSWSFQFCEEWGYFMGGAPEGHPTIVSRLLTPEYTQQVCRLAFPPGKLHRKSMSYLSRLAIR